DERDGGGGFEPACGANRPRRGKSGGRPVVHGLPPAERSAGPTMTWAWRSVSGRTGPEASRDERLARGPPLPRGLLMNHPADFGFVTARGLATARRSRRRWPG